jgi:hypothetical protein
VWGGAKCKELGRAHREADARTCVTVDCWKPRAVGHVACGAIGFTLFWITFAITTKWCRDEMTVFGRVFATAVAFDMFMWQLLHAGFYHLWQWVNAEAETVTYDLHPIDGQVVYVGPVADAAADHPAPDGLVKVPYAGQKGVLPGPRVSHDDTDGDSGASGGVQPKRDVYGLVEIDTKEEIARRQAVVAAAAAAPPPPSAAVLRDMLELSVDDDDVDDLDDDGRALRQAEKALEM